MMAMGNHEMEAWYTPDGYGGVRARFTMPGSALSASTGSYSWRCQNVDDDNARPLTVRSLTEDGTAVDQFVVRRSK